MGPFGRRALGVAVVALVPSCNLAVSGLGAADGGSIGEAGPPDATTGHDGAGGGGGGGDSAPDTTATDSGDDARDGSTTTDAGVDACAPPDGGSPNTVVAVRAGKISIDGDLSEWKALCPDIHSLTPGNAGLAQLSPGDAGISATFALAWDPTHLYFASTVTDPSLDGNDPLPFNNDSIEIYVSNDSPPSGDYSANDHQFVIDYKNLEGEYAQGVTVTTTGLASATTTSTTGYVVEGSIDVSALGVSNVKGGDSYGFDFIQNDTAGTVAAANVLIWTIATPSNCGCQGGCCCNTSPPLPFCSTLSFGTATLLP